MGSIRLNGRSYGGSPTVTDANHLICEDGSGNTITVQSAIQNILGDFATIESSTAASKAYAVGDYLILNGNFYKVTTAISQGDTITVGTNVVRTNVGDEFKSFEFPVRELTKAQYTALPSSQQNDGTIYLITDDDGGWEAENSTYDNTSSGLNAENVQDALDEINSNIDDLGADDVTYDNTESGLTATNVQDAIDELGTGGLHTYQPDIHLLNETGGISVSNKEFYYLCTKHFLFISGRFNVTSYTGSQSIQISYPTGITAQDCGVTPVGTVYLNTSYSGVPLSLRTQGTNAVWIQAGAGGYSKTAIGTGYVLVNAFIPR